MPKKDFVFTPQDLYQLICHYTDGGVPLAGEVKDILVHPHMQRKIGLVVESGEWETDQPLFLSYDGKRVASWTKGQEEQTWEEKNETPNRQ